MKLSMSVDVLPCTLDVPFDRRGLAEAKISVTEGDLSRNISLLSERDGSFKREHISAMLRLFADQIDRKYGETKEAA
jgi:hypothetical protein